MANRPPRINRKTAVFRVIVATLTAVPAFVGTSFIDTSAAESAERHGRKKYRYVRVVPPKKVYDDNSVWYPNNADKLKFGSRIWWDQMQREGRIGGGGGFWR